ncbi:MAG: transcription termination/antitermination protein NusA [Candidatus Omnitrophica bacterium]|nr:transcription termination/antitermination protein NusA [Candidatus Omnitrophota bacterium]
MNQELLATLEYIEKEKNIDKGTLLEALKQALVSACRKTYPESQEIDIQINPDTADIKVYRDGKVIDDADFGRIAAQTAKQVIIQKIREAERRSIYDEYIKKQGDLISGTVHRFEKKAIIVDLGKTEGILPAREQSSKEEFRQGDYVKAYVLEVKKTPSGPEIILSRAHEGLVKRLFEIEVAEIHEGIVQIKGIAREAGSRTKIAVHSSDSKIDPVGSCVGMRGQRVKNIVRELRGEKIDIIRWSDDIETYMRESLKPAEIAEVKLNRKETGAEVFVADDQLSLTIGKKGQNVRLASKLLDWRLDVRSLSQKVPISSLEGVGPKIVEALKEAGIISIKDILKSSPEELIKIKGVGPKTAEKIFRSAHQSILQGGKPPSAPSPPKEKEAGEVEEVKKDETTGESNNESP